MKVRATMRRTAGIVLGLSFWLVLGMIAAPEAKAQCSAPYYIEQRFPTAGVEETRWKLCWLNDPRAGLTIYEAYFRTSPRSPWVKVLQEAQLAQLFVPYDKGSPRFYDLSLTSRYGVRPQDCMGSVIGSGDEEAICKEVMQRGIAWLNYQPEAKKARKGEELVLWSVLNAGNYNYVVQWMFRDDGIIMGRAGATAQNLPSIPWEPHLHAPTWRLHMNFNNSRRNTVYEGNHSREDKKDILRVIEKDSGLVWNPEKYTWLDIEDETLKNRWNKKSGYRLMPSFHGIPRESEDFTKYTYWVTQFAVGETSGVDLPSYLRDRSVVNADVQIWYYGGMHHRPRSEDGIGPDPGPWDGSALIMWSDFMLVPINMFDKTPLFP